MLKSDAELYLQQWFYNTRKIFKYIQEFVPIEYIMILKTADDKFEVDLKESTYPLKIKDKEELITLMHNRSLVYFCEFTYKSPLELKTGGCTAGCWVLNSGHHVHNCKLYKG